RIRSVFERQFRRRTRSRRKRSTLTGKTGYDAGEYALDCTIYDISETGARVVLPPNYGLPDKVVLMDMRNRMAHAAAVVPTERTQRGLKFDQSFPINNRLPAKFEFLKRIWIIASAR